MEALYAQRPASLRVTDSGKKERDPQYHCVMEKVRLASAGHITSIVALHAAVHCLTDIHCACSKQQSCKVYLHACNQSLGLCDCGDCHM